MSIRIILEREEKANVIRLYGRLAGEGALAEFLRLCESTSSPLIIDLSELRFADEEGLAALRSLGETNGTELIGASPYICLLLDI